MNSEDEFINKHNTLIVEYHKTDNRYVILKKLDKKSVQELNNLKKNKDTDHKELEKTISNIRGIDMSYLSSNDFYSDDIYKTLKKEIDKIIIIDTNFPNHKSNTNKNYNPKIFTEFLRKKQKKIKVKKDTLLNETYYKLKKNLKGKAKTTRIFAGVGIVLTVYNAFTNPTIQSIGLPGAISIGSIAGYLNNKKFVDNLEKSYDLEKDRYDALENTLNNIKDKKTKITVIKLK